MRTIAIMNNKGGVGKTTTTAAMADIMTLDYGKRVLLVDADAQGNLSDFCRVEPQEGSTLLDLLEGTQEPYYQDFVTPVRDRLDIIPADMDLISADIGAIRDGRCNLQALDDLRGSAEEDGTYDYMLIDCPPSFSAACMAALTAADAVVIPLRMDAFSTSGMAQLTAQVRNMTSVNDRLTVAGVLATQFQRTAEEREAIGIIERSGRLPVYSTRIRQSPRVSASTFAREPLVTFSPHCAAAKDYRRFVAEFLGQEGGYRA